MFRTPIIQPARRQRVSTSQVSSASSTNFFYKAFAFLLTYLAYTAFHLSRKPLSVVKSAPSFLNCPLDHNRNISVCQAWINQLEGKSEGEAKNILGLLDTSFLLSYAVSMFFSGVLAEKIDLRKFLAMGMLLSGLFTTFFGFSQFLNVHSVWYFFFIQVVSGMFQSTGWPAVVTVMANWFGKGKRGLVMGLWNSHTSVGNILGSLLAGYYVSGHYWGDAFIVPGVILMGASALIYFCLAPHPDQTELCLHNNNHLYEELSVKETKSLIKNKVEDTKCLEIIKQISSSPSSDVPVSFWKALNIPGVVEFSLSLFFAKMVSYTFLYWLPSYLHSTMDLGAEQAANLSTVFDVGGVLGAVLAGLLCDRWSSPGSTCSLLLLSSLPLLSQLSLAPLSSDSLLVVNLFLLGCCVTGPYALISTAVSQELGQHPSLQGSSGALATVTAIIDGTGSLGAVLGPLLAGWLSGTRGWHSVFKLLMAANIMAVLFLVRQVKTEIQNNLKTFYEGFTKKGKEHLPVKERSNYNTFV